MTTRLKYLTSDLYLHHANIDFTALSYMWQTYKIDRKPSTAFWEAGQSYENLFFWRHSKRGALLQSVLITHDPLLGGRRERDWLHPTDVSHSAPHMPETNLLLWDCGSAVRLNGEDVLDVRLCQINPWNAFKVVHTLQDRCFELNASCKDIFVCLQLKDVMVFII